MKYGIIGAFFLFFHLFSPFSFAYEIEGLPLCYYKDKKFVNFGDYLSLKLVERIVGGQVKEFQKGERKFLAIGSILILARNEDVLWGTGMNAKRTDVNKYKFEYLDIRAVRGPLTREFIMKNFNIYCPEVYGDPALLIPYFFPEFKKAKNPKYDYIIIPHYADMGQLSKENYSNVVYPTEPWNDVIRKIVDSQFVISGSLHGLIIAEAYGIPARYLRVSDYEPLFKYCDYYLGTNRPNFSYATTVEDALQMGGEIPFECDLEKIYQAFPFEYWPNANFKNPDFRKKV